MRTGTWYKVQCTVTRYRVKVRVQGTEYKVQGSEYRFYIYSYYHNNILEYGSIAVLLNFPITLYP